MLSWARLKRTKSKKNIYQQSSTLATSKIKSGYNIGSETTAVASRTKPSKTPDADETMPVATVTAPRPTPTVAHQPEQQASAITTVAQPPKFTPTPAVPAHGTIPKPQQVSAREPGETDNANPQEQNKNPEPQ